LDDVSYAAIVAEFELHLSVFMGPEVAINLEPFALNDLVNASETIHPPLRYEVFDFCLMILSFNETFSVNLGVALVTVSHQVVRLLVESHAF
jgi:hypothetical protein